MDAIFADCTSELRNVINERHLPIMDGLRIHDGSPSEDEFIELAKNANVICVEHTVITPRLLDACSNLHTIIFMGTGAESYIPEGEAKRHGVRIINIPDYAATAVAEHAMALTFAAARKISLMNRAVRQGIWQPQGGLQIKGSKVAVIGLGGIGKTYADMAARLDMKVAGWSYTAKHLSYYVDDLEQALLGAKFLSLHLALNAKTTGIIGKRELSLLSPGAIIINTARAALIDERALAGALDSGQVGHVGLDVLWEEPPQKGCPWIRRENVTLTPHAAYMTDEAYEELWKRTMNMLQSVKG